MEKFCVKMKISSIFYKLGADLCGEFKLDRKKYKIKELGARKERVLNETKNIIVQLIVKTYVNYF